jgi:tRNA threonylcarbamoyladenosine biosynthesis protein TsaE
MEIIYSLSEIDLIAKKVCNSITNPIITFNGQMGSGKTTLIKSICKHLNFKENISSPTFSLVNTYVNSSNKIIHHFDLYRIKSIEEAMDFGIEEYLDSGNMCLIEWPKIITKLLNNPMNQIEIQIVEYNKRKISLK